MALHRSRTNLALSFELNGTISICQRRRRSRRNLGSELISDDVYLRVALPQSIANELLAEGIAEESIEVRNVAEILSIAVDGINDAAAVVAVIAGAVATGKFTRKLVDRARRAREPGEPIIVRLTRAGRVIETTIPDDSDASVAQLTESIRREIADWPR